MAIRKSKAAGRGALRAQLGSGFDQTPRVPAKTTLYASAAAHSRLMFLVNVTTAGR